MADGGQTSRNVISINIVRCSRWGHKYFPVNRFEWPHVRSHFVVILTLFIGKKREIEFLIFWFVFVVPRCIRLRSSLFYSFFWWAFLDHVSSYFCPSTIFHYILQSRGQPWYWWSSSHINLSTTRISFILWLDKSQLSHHHFISFSQKIYSKSTYGTPVRTHGAHSNVIQKFIHTFGYGTIIKRWFMNSQSGFSWLFIIIIV